MHSGEQGLESESSNQRPGPDLWTLITYGVLFVISALTWAGVVLQVGAMPESAGSMKTTNGMNMEPTGPTLLQAGAFLLAWGVMMTAMMLPSAAPMIALYGTIRRNAARTHQKSIPGLLFALVYLGLWLAFGLPVYLGSLIINAAAANTFIANLLPYALALVLGVAGIYQLSPLKQVCLRECRSPLGFLMGHWRSGYSGTLKLALLHGFYCLGCCWALMVVLVSAGAMALQWVLLIAVLVFAEKLLPLGKWVSFITGGILIILSFLIIIDPGLAGLLRGQPMGM
jgi:predicted metal-binding membrane protein